MDCIIVGDCESPLGSAHEFHTIGSPDFPGFTLDIGQGFQFVSCIVCGGGIKLEIPVFCLRFSHLYTEDVTIALFLSFDLLGPFCCLSLLGITFSFCVTDTLPTFHINIISAGFADVNLSFFYF